MQEESHFFTIGAGKKCLCPLLSPGALSHKCLPVSPPSLFLPALQAEGLASGPRSSREILAQSSAFGIISIHCYSSATEALPAGFGLSKTSFTSSGKPCTVPPTPAFNQHRVPWLCLRSAPQVTSVIENVTHPWSPAPDPGLGTSATCKWIKVHKLCVCLP